MLIKKLLREALNAYEEPLKVYIREEADFDPFSHVGGTLPEPQPEEEIDVKNECLLTIHHQIQNWGK